MSNQDMFSGNQGENHSENNQGSSLDALVGEGKKFDSVEALAKGKMESDAYINTLTRKLEEAAEELQKRTTAEEVANQIREQMQNTNNSSNQGPQNLGENNNGGENNENKPTQSSVSPEDISKLVSAKLEETEKQNAAKKNIQEVTKVLEEKIGATAPAFIEKKATELGVTLEYLKEQAALSPKAFLRLINLDSAPSAGGMFTPPSSSSNEFNRLNSGDHNRGGVRNKSYYDKIYKENPSLRLNKEMILQEHRDALKLGDAFLN